MACCLAVALVIAVLRAGWYRLVPGRRPARVGFAPPARRPAPGATAVATAPVQWAARGVAATPVLPPAHRGNGPVAPPRVPVRHRVGFALVIAGAGWSVLSVLAMHVPGGATHSHGVPVPVDLALHGSGAAGVLMHGPGLVAIAVGLLLVLGRSRQLPTQRFPTQRFEAQRFEARQQFEA